MTTRASGTFEITMDPHSPYDTADGVNIGRVSLNKRFEGDLVGSGIGEMIGAVTGVKGSAGYVAIERVIGTLHGRAGSFVLQHAGTMNRGEASLSVNVVPDSGAGELAGLAGRMKIDIVGGRHLYTFEYTLGSVERAAEAPPGE
jgi:hypothetical protein